MERGIIIYYLAGSTMVLLLITAIITYAFLHQKKVVQLRLRLKEEDLQKRQAVFDALQEGQEKERTRLAEELHDGVAARLSGLKMNLEYLNSNTTENFELISKIFSCVTETLEEVREISQNLQPYFFADKNLEQLFRELIEQVNTSGKCRYDLVMNGIKVDIPKTTKLQVYRIVAELLNNVQKHANATQASVQVNTEDDNLEIVVEDNGAGFVTNNHSSHGIGLMNIHSRINVCKGTLNIDSSTKGTTVIIEIPLNTTS